MATAGKSFTNHPAVMDFNGTSYFWYHNSALPGGSGYTRSIAVEKFNYNSDSTIPTISMTTNGPPMVGTLDPYVRQEAEIAFSSGLKTEVCSEGGMAVSNINNNDYIKVKGVAFGSTGAKTLSHASLLLGVVERLKCAWLVRVERLSVAGLRGRP